MTTLGLLGGASWVSTARYYTELQRGAARRGAEHALPLAVWSLDFAAVLAAQAAGDVAAERALLLDGAERLRAAGADLLMICSTTLHRFADDVAAVRPVLHIGDAVAASVAATGAHRVGLLATAVTTGTGTYAAHLTAHAGVEVLTPEPADVAALDALIRREDGVGRPTPDGEAELRAIAGRLVARGADVLLQGCTSLEVATLATAGVPVVDAVAAHVDAALDAALAPTRTDP